jgi:SAM-dependent methyltransferase
VGDSGKYRERITRSKFSLICCAIAIHPGTRLLDIGCDSGVLLRMFESIGAECYGIDISADAVIRAKHNGVSQAAADLLPFREGSFDVCISSHVIEHLERPEALVREAAGALKPSGTLALIYPWELFRGMTVIPDLVVSGQWPLPGALSRIHRHVITPEKVRNFSEPYELTEVRGGLFWGFPYVVPQYFSILRKSGLSNEPPAPVAAAK